ncbi:hypothetical protein MASR2M15_18740 [Anaerolineales bacterium]
MNGRIGGKYRRAWFWIVLALLVLLLTFVFVLMRLLPPLPDPAGMILINRSENGMGRAYWLDPATGILTPLQGEDTMNRPDLAPDGNQIVYVNWPGLAIYNLSTRRIQQIITVERDSDPNWSPDGHSIVFVHSRDFSSALFLYDMTTHERHQLTDYQNDLEPDWSPDGQRIVFTSSRDGFQELYTIKPDGTDRQRLTHNTGLNDLMASYSPDGQYIAYMTNYSVGDNSGEIWVMKADGTEQVQITDNDHYDFYPIWSPDGRYIVFSGKTAETDIDIFVYDFLAEQVHQITALATIDANPIWSPNSEWIAFVSYTSNGQQSQIYIVRPDGSSLAPVVDVSRSYSLLLWIASFE